MRKFIYECVKKSTVKITILGKTGWGSGFLVSPDLVLTCSHVVKEAATVSVTTAGLSSPMISIPGQIIFNEPHIDTALVRLEWTPDNPTSAYLDTGSESYLPGDELFIYGYSDTFSRGDPVIAVCEGETGDDHPFIKFKGCQIRPGQSGAPVMNTRTGKICGMVKFTRNRDNNLGGGAIPIRCIAATFPLLISLQEKQHQLNSAWKNALSEIYPLASSNLVCNLPTDVYTDFMFREKELLDVLDFLSPSRRPYVLTIDGIGGIGKTALAVEAARLCWEDAKSGNPNNRPFFDAIIFITAKTSYLKAMKILKAPRISRTLSDIYRNISEVLGDQSIIQSPVEHQREKVYESLARQLTLLIIDNLETMDLDSQAEVMSFLEHIPVGTKAIVTSRIRHVINASMNLKELSRKESIKLVQQHASESKIKCIRDDANLIYEIFGGVPLALINAVGLKVLDYPLENLRHHENIYSSNAMEFCFAITKEVLSERAYKLFKSFGMFSSPPTLSALAEVAGLTEPSADECMEELSRLSLVKLYKNRYHIVSFTRKYTMLKLAEDPDFASQARERWIKWYLRYTKKYGGKDAEKWSFNYKCLRHEHGNLQGLLQWCVDQERYSEIKDLWHWLENYLDVYGYWQERLDILEVLESMARVRGDKAILAKVFAARGWTLILMGGNYQTEGRIYLLRAFSLRKSLDHHSQARLANYFAVLRITRKEYSKALTWLDREERFTKGVLLDEEDKLRVLARVCYYKGERLYRLRQYEPAKKLFEKVVLLGRGIKWERFVNYAQNWLAEIAVIQNDLDGARQLLRLGLDEALQNEEQRRIAHYQATYARLELKCENFAEALRMAKKSLAIFKKENMKADERDISSLVNKITTLQDEKYS